ncbi:MAG: head-tail adaptor protein [Clostridia bacterium]|nr:head-tail adaptor protein [Clostridia bacterium]
MSYGKMNGFADIVRTIRYKDAEGFAVNHEEIMASVRIYREGRHGSMKWANLAAFSEATDLFRFRYMAGLHIVPGDCIVCDGSRYEITSVENVRGKGMYLEVMAKRVEGMNG